MAGYRLKRQFAGKFVVMSADDEQVFGPATHAEAQAWIAEREGAAPAAPAPAATGDAPTARQLREWDRKVDEALKAPLIEEEAELRALLAKRRKDDEVDYLVRQIKPLLAAGLEGGRRERIRFIRQASPKAA